MPGEGDGALQPARQRRKHGDPAVCGREAAVGGAVEQREQGMMSRHAVEVREDLAVRRRAPAFAGMDEVDGDLGVLGPVRGAGVLAAGDLSVPAAAGRDPPRETRNPPRTLPVGRPCRRSVSRA
jgi:hypothetical protein